MDTVQCIKCECRLEHKKEKKEMVAEGKLGYKTAPFYYHNF